jgi:hypothetical protein
MSSPLWHAAPGGIGRKLNYAVPVIPTPLDLPMNEARKRPGMVVT